MIPEGNPTQSLGGRDAELAAFVKALIENPSRIDELSATHIKETSLFCFGRLLFGWAADPHHLSG